MWHFLLRTGVALVMVAPLFAFSITLGLSPNTRSVTVGSQVSVDLTVTGLGQGAPPSIGSYDLNVAFDESVLDFQSITFGTQLDVLGLGGIQRTTPGEGTLNLFELSLDASSDLDALQPGTFVVATIAFQAIGSGTSELLIELNALADALGDPLSADVVSGEVSVARNGIPEPSTPFLLLLSLALLRLGSRQSLLEVDFSRGEHDGVPSPSFPLGDPHLTKIY